METWEGSKYIYSIDTDSKYAIKVDLSKDGKAKIVSTHGEAYGTFETKDGRVNITFSENKIKYKAFTVGIEPGYNNYFQIANGVGPSFHRR